MRTPEEVLKAFRKQSSSNKQLHKAVLVNTLRSQEVMNTVDSKLREVYNG